MITDTLKEIESTKSKLAELEKKAATELKKKLVNLHKDLGYDTRACLIAALGELEGTPKRGRKAKVASEATGKKRGKRARITPEMKAEIVAALEGGAKGAAVAKQFGISVPAVQLIKKAAGLTKTRS